MQLCINDATMQRCIKILYIKSFTNLLDQVEWVSQNIPISTTNTCITIISDLWLCPTDTPCITITSDLSNRQSVYNYHEWPVQPTLRV